MIRRFLSKSGQDVTHARVSGFAVSSLEINEQSQFLLGTTPRPKNLNGKTGSSWCFRPPVSKLYLQYLPVASSPEPLPLAGCAG